MKDSNSLSDHLKNEFCKDKEIISSLSFKIQSSVSDKELLTLGSFVLFECLFDPFTGSRRYLWVSPLNSDKLTFISVLTQGTNSKTVHISSWSRFYSRIVDEWAENLSFIPAHNQLMSVRHAVYDLMKLLGS